MYRTQIQELKLSYDEFNIIKRISELCNNMYNVALYNIRQHFFETGSYLSYNSNYHLFKENENYKLLNSNVAQQIARSVDYAFKSFFKLNSLKKEGKYNEKVNIPHYKEKGSTSKIVIQQIQIDKDGYFLIPMSVKFKKEHGAIKIKVPSNLDISTIKYVEILPICHSKRFIVHWVYELQNDTTTILLDDKCISIDLGVNNLLTCVTNFGEAFIVDGRQLKSVNQYTNKINAALKSSIDKKGIKESKKIDNLWKYRNNYVRNYINKACRLVINYCLENSIGNLIIGDNNDFQRNSNIGHINNQNFVNIPLGKIKERLKQLCDQYSIKYIEQEESYTSKASFFDNDDIPVYGTIKETPIFSGNRNNRLYKTKSGLIVNADMNGVLNIMKKAIKANSLNCSLSMSSFIKDGLVLYPKRRHLSAV